MKVLNILHLPWFAGTEKAYLTYCELLSMLGYEVICLIPKNAQIKKHLSHHYQVIEDDGVLLAKGKLNLISVFKYYRLVKTLKIDIVFAHSAGIVKLFCKVLFWLKTPLIAVNHGFNPRNITKADTVIALNTISQKEMEDYVREHRSEHTKIYKLPNALKIDTGLYSPKKSPPKVIGVICRLTKDKGIDYFIEALFFLKSHGYHLKAKIAGDGEEKANLIKLVKKRGLEKDIEFLGWVVDSNIFYSKINILCHPSLHETFGLVLLEAMQYGIPIISTATNGAKEIVRHGENGLLANIADSASLTEQILILLKTKSLGPTLAKQAYADLVSKYSYKVVAKQLSKIINKTIKRFGP